MAVLPIATLKANMQIGQLGSITATDIHDLIDTLEDRSTQAVIRSSTGYTATVNDNRRIIIINSASLQTIALPNSLPAGWECGILQMGTGQVAFTVTGGTLLSRSGHTRTAGQYAMASLFCESNAGTAPVVILTGDTAT
jgi:hypothetical protein